jgi:hypothetical protein
MHNWHVDHRVPTVGFMSRDDAHILYNARWQASTGDRPLYAWSACHLALAGVHLNVDPLLSEPQFHDSVDSSLRAARVHGRVMMPAIL